MSGDLAVSVGVTLAFLLGLEIYLRWTQTVFVPGEGEPAFRLAMSGPDLVIRHTPAGRRLVPNAHVLIRNHPVSQRDVLMDINSLGFRDHAISKHKGANEFRVLVLGDSVTWADSVAVDETFVEQAEHLLNPGSGGGARVELINGGVGDIGLREAMDILEEQGVSAQPDVVVVAFYLNDSRPPWGFSAERGHRGWMRRHSALAEFVAHRLRLWRWSREQGADRFRWVHGNKTLDWQHDRAAFLQLVDMAAYDWGAAWRSESWDVVAHELDRLRRSSQRHGFEVSVVVFPVAFQVYADFVEDFPQRTLETAARARGFAYLDLLPLLRKHRMEELFFDQCHLTVHGHDVVGQALAAYLYRTYLQ